jgi:DNA-binding MarR family transcriptional regulator
VLAETKHVPVVRGFLRTYSTLKPYPLTTGEAMFIIHLMDFKWGAASPFPKYKTIADRMGVSEKQARRFAQSLEVKGYLVRESRGGRRSNRFVLTKLFAALEERVQSEEYRRSVSKPRPRRPVRVVAPAVERVASSA